MERLSGLNECVCVCVWVCVWVCVCESDRLIVEPQLANFMLIQHTRTLKRLKCVSVCLLPAGVLDTSHVDSCVL